jgi:hypothetical protein
MKKTSQFAQLILSTFLMLLIASVAYSKQTKPEQQRIHAAKMAYMVDRLQLTPEQSAAFVPVYKNYEADFRAVRAPFVKKYKLDEMEEGPGNMTVRQYVEDDLDYQQQVIELKRGYNDRFLKVITSRQLADMHIAEREFKQILVKRLKNMKQKQQNKQLSK